MTEVTIKNKYFLGHYDYITVWAAGKEYHLKPDSEFTFLGLLQVDNSLRMGSLALGAGKLRTIFTVVLPVAMPAILQGVILAVGRIVGETAALLFTLGSATGTVSEKFILSDGVAVCFSIFESSII